MRWLLTCVLLCRVSYGGAGWCQRTLNAAADTALRALDGFVQYGIDVTNSGGRRIFLKPVKPENTEPNTRWYGFLTDPASNEQSVFFLLRDHVTNIVQFVPRRITHAYFGTAYDFTPRRALYSHAIERPTRWATRRLLRQEMDWTHLVTFGLGTMTSVLFWNWIDEKNEQILDAKQISEIEKHAEEWDTLIRHDVRYRDIADAVASGELTQEEAQAQSVMRNELFYAYYDFMKKSPEAPREAFLTGPFFESIRDWKENGISDKPGFRKLKGFSRSLSDEQIDDLIAETHEYLAITEILSLWMTNNPALQTMGAKSADVRRLRAAIEADDFNVKLSVLEARGKITRAQRGSYLQEDAKWQRTFAEWKILGVEKLKKKNCTYLDVPLTLNDIRAEILEEISP